MMLDENSYVHVLTQMPPYDTIVEYANGSRIHVGLSRIVVGWFAAKLNFS